LTPLIVIFVILCLFIGSLRNPIFGVMGYLSVYFIYNPEIWWSYYVARYVYRPSLMAMLFIVLGSIFHLRNLNWSFSRKEIEYVLFLMVAWIASIFLGVGMNEESWQYLDKLSKLFVFLFFLVRIVISIEDYRYVYWLTIISAMFLAYQSHITGAYHDGRLDNIGGIDFSEANGLSSFMSVGIIFISFKMLQYPIWKKFLCVIAIVLMLDTIVLTQSRAAFIGLAVAFPFVLFQPLKKYRKQIYVYLLLSLVLFLFIAPPAFWERMGTIGEEAKEIDSKNQLNENQQISRIDFWKT